MAKPNRSVCIMCLLADVGFDPLGFSTTITELGGDLNYVREAELMHGRQAMLAW